MTGGPLTAWAQLLRVSALSTVPGDALVGAAATGRAPGRGTALAAGASLCLYEAGMALNDWADREEDARERPERPLPSGRISPAAALAAAAGLTAAGLVCAARAGRLPLAVATALAGTVWAYDLRLKHTPAGPAAMAAARSLDVLLGAAATTASGAPLRTASPTPATSATPAASAPGSAGAGGRSPAWGSAPADGCASVGGSAGAGGGSSAWGSARAGGRAPAWDAFSARGSAPARGFGVVGGSAPARGFGVVGGSAPTRGSAPFGGAAPALGAAAVMGAHTLAVTAVSRREAEGGAPAVPLAALGVVGAIAGLVARQRTPLVVAASAAYAQTAGRPLAHAALNPSPPLLQRGVGGGIRAMLPLQAALAARISRTAGEGAAGGDADRTTSNRAAGSVSALALLGLLPVARRLSRRFSPT
ncbi:UbiA family prenyltransferase [Streptomyces oryzae]|uniref:UbiA family prenyltransferase n=1 Tax=Streptomyces oryzae TaxID=1434886 RepID=A0ABS3XH02_9ACTN|nr:UbiA family prenyltransferase [Streptomyces oryzae]MBO8194581.1 UbiA family prenyltransferase [Streptomyces oryzae]